MRHKHHAIVFVARIMIHLFTILMFVSPSLAEENLELYVGTDTGTALSGLNVYAFTGAGAYTGVKAVTDAGGIATFLASDFDAGAYRFRADYLGNQFWSSVIALPDTLSLDLIIQEGTAEVTVTTGAGPSQETRLYLFSGVGSYLGINDETDVNGQAAFDLPVDREFKFRADILGSRYWSEAVTILAGVNDILIDAGGGTLEVQVEKGAGSPMEGIRAYLFSSSGSYLGLSDVTDASGLAEFNVPEGDYKVRADYLGNQFWSNVTTVAGDTLLTLPIPHQDVVITVQGAYQGTLDPLEGLKAYLFTSGGSYMGQYQVTDGSGQATFHLPEQSYKVRADYLGQQFWSGDFTWQDSDVGIPMADAEVTVTGAGQPLEGVKVYVFSGSGSYLGVNGTTNMEGDVTFRLPASSYNFRADYQGSQYWSGAATLTADQVNPVPISTGGGQFTLTVLKGAGDPLVGVKCYVFSESGSYLGLNDTTDANGRVSFPLADGNYKFRVDYLGSQFWTDIYEIPAVLSDDFTIPHQDVVITVQGTYQGAPDPLEGLKVYLFTSAGSYMGQYQVTDGSGQATFTLPEQSYKVRADYLGQQFWSDVLTWQDRNILISKGTAHVHVTRMGADLGGAKVFLFTESGSYLGINATTDSSGTVEFLLPAGPYKFRADEGGDQRWSEETVIIADQATEVDMEMEDVLPPTVSLSADTTSIQMGESSTLIWNSTNAYSVSIDQGVGEVDPSGSIEVSPTATTTYNITATGAAGTATDSVTVSVSHPLPTISISADPGSIYAGDSSTLSWSSTNADYVSIDQGIGPVNPIGTMMISPGYTTTYTITASGPGGSTTAAVTVTILTTMPDVTELTSGHPTGWDGFGFTVDIEGAYAVVGAYWDSSAGAYAGAAYVYELTLEGWNEMAKLTANDTADWDLFGYSVAINGDYIIVGSVNADSNVVEDAGASYIFKRNGSMWTEVAKLTAGDGQNGDWFGSSVSINGEYAIIGAFYADSDTASNSGVAYIFKTDGLAWTEVTKLAASDAEGGDEFGISVSINGDYAIVGADNGDSDTIDDTGAAYIFECNSDEWNEVAKLTASDSEGWAYFGESVSIYGNNAVVGAFGSNNFSGAAYIFKQDSTGWSEVEKLTASDGEAYDYFGGSVDIYGDYVAVGADYGDSITIMDSGAAYIYNYSASAWTEIKKLTPGDAQELDGFGISIGIYNNSVIVGAPKDSKYAPLPGSAYIYPLTHTTGRPSITLYEPDGYRDSIDGMHIIRWIDHDPDDNATISLYYDNEYGGADGILIETGIPEDPDGEIYDEYFWDTSGVPDGDYFIYAVIDDGKSDPVINYSNGAMHVEKTMSNEIKLTTSDADDYFSSSVSIDGDYAIVGADYDKFNGIESGSVFIFKRVGSIWVKQALLIPDDAEDFDEFGSAVDIDGEVVIVSAPEDNHNGIRSGSASVFKREGAIWSQQAKIVANDRQDGDKFGNSVSISGDYAIIGAVGDDGGGYESGAAYIFRFNGSIWHQHAKLTITDAQLLERFGCSVSIDGDYAIAGAENDFSNTGWESGSAYIYKRIGTNWILQNKLDPQNAEPYDHFGFSVAIEGDYAIVGAPYDDDYGDASGAAYVYKRDETHWDFHQKITYDESQAGDHFGSSVDIDDEYAVISAVKESYKGVFRVYKRYGSYWSYRSSHSAKDSAEDEWDHFGDSIALSNGHAISSCSGYFDSTSVGAAYIYTVFRANIGTANDSIVLSDSTTLSWHTIDAISVFIDNGIGMVDTNGSVTVSPTETTTYTITAETEWGTFTDSITVTVNPIGITIAGPYEYDTIYKPDTLVEGTITNALGLEVGININGVVAIVDGDHFMANHVPLDDGENTITANAMAADGSTAQDSVFIYADTSGDYIRLTADEESGISPFETTLKVDGSFDFQNPEITYTGPGTVEFLTNENENEYTVSITTEGLYIFTVEADNGEIYYTDSVAIQVMNEATLDSLLRAKWNGMKSALGDGDIETALTFHHELEIDKYEAIYNLLGNDLQVKAQQMQDIEPVMMEGSRAKYGIFREHIINSQPVTIAYFIYFVKDEDGLWKIEGY